ncbi:ATP-binding protein [Candidatus Dependentiae bacterium]|jgi:predicted AAA+ superfamily ATPase|nr:ATP-binding protein [Candidatus Dependentiae bacterium]
MNRNYFLKQIDFNFGIHSVCGLLGPRQVGKTTLAREYAARYPNAYLLDLENPFDLARLENPMLTLQNIKSDLIVIDEVQLRPDLFPILRVLVDEKPRKFLILGSASRDLLQQSSETLAGRIGYIELPPFSLEEASDHDRLWVRGGFPRSYLANSEKESFAWRQSYISTFMERDIPNLGFNVPPPLMKRLWMMLAHYHGNILNASEIGNSLDISNHTVRRYLDILAGTFMVRELQPWFENIGKRQVKSPKIYIRDSGLLHALLNIPDYDALQIYPKLGASWEGFALEEIIKQHHAQTDECYFWSTQSGAELDLLIIKDGKKIGFEFKYTDFPKITKSMYISLQDLDLDHLYLVYPHHETFPLAEKITARGLVKID